MTTLDLSRPPHHTTGRREKRSTNREGRGLFNLEGRKIVMGNCCGIKITSSDTASPPSGDIHVSASLDYLSRLIETKLWLLISKLVFGVVGFSVLVVSDKLPVVFFFILRPFSSSGFRHAAAIFFLSFLKRKEWKPRNIFFSFFSKKKRVEA